MVFHHVPSHVTCIIFLCTVLGVKDVDAFNVAFCEIGGHLPVKSKSKHVQFHHLFCQFVLHCALEDGYVVHVFKDCRVY